MSRNRESHPFRMALAIALLAVVATAGRARAQEQPVNVDPSELDRRTDLVGKLVSIDDRMLYYQYHQGKGYDELRLKRTNMVFRLPPPLRPDSPTRPTPVIVQGRLRRDGEQLVCDVLAVKTMPSDIARLDQAIAALSPRDFKGRKAWAAWAEKRGREFKEPALVHKAEAIDAEAFRIEADQTRGAVDAPAEWLRMAEDARRRKLQEPEASALAHRAIRARLAAASDVAAAREALTLVDRFFPNAARDVDSGRRNLSRWEQPYVNDPAAAYRAASPDIRKGFDRRLWADARQKTFELEASADPQAAIDLAPRAEADLPERREFAASLLNRGLEQATRNLASLRLSEVRTLGQTYRDRLQNPEKALQLYRDWLKVQRDRLSPTDAEGPVDLAGLYEELLQDRQSSRALLERAWKIDPGSRTIAEAFRVRGYRRVKDQWVEELGGTAAAEPGQEKGAGTPSPSMPGRGLRGLTPDEVSQQLRSTPDRKVLSGTKGQLIEQWIFRSPTQRGWRYVNFVRTPGEVLPRVVSDYTLPESAVGKGFATSH